MSLLGNIIEWQSFKKINVRSGFPHKLGVTKEKRQQEIVISLTSYPARIGSAYKTICTLLQQDLLPDRVILWLAEEQFPQKKGIPNSILKLQKSGLEIRWYHDIRSYKKLIPALYEFPNALIVTVDDDWYYRKDMLRILIEEHERFPNEIIGHSVTHPYLDENNCIKSSKKIGNYKGTSSYFNKILSGSGTLFHRSFLDSEVFNEEMFMQEAPTNDDIWFWAMAVKKGTRIRLAQSAVGTTLMTDAENQLQSSLGIYNLSENLYEVVSNRMLELYPEVLKNLLEERANMGR